MTESCMKEFLWEKIEETHLKDYIKIQMLDKKSKKEIVLFAT